MNKAVKFSFLVIFVMLLLVNVKTVNAASDITNLKQTDADTDSVKIRFEGTADADGFYIYISKDGSTYKRMDGDTSKYPDTFAENAYIRDLNPGRTYYVKVSQAKYYSNTGVYTEGTKSDALQVVTQPEDVTGLKQTDSSKSSVTLKWDSISGVTGYYVKDRFTGKTVKTVSTNKAKISMSQCDYTEYRVTAYMKSSSGYVVESDKYMAVGAYSAPGKPTKVATKNNLSWNSKVTKADVFWSYNSKDVNEPDGYQLEIYTINGKTKLKTYNVKYCNKTFKLPSKAKNKGFQIRVRAYNKGNGKKYYGSWTSKKTIVPLARVTKFKQKGKTSATVKWKKVKNATKYTIYVCKNTDVFKLKWKKVATVSKSKTSYTIKNLKKGKGIGVYVIPTVKVGSKKYTAVKAFVSYTTTYIKK